jgi:hypothetical protein
MTDFPEVHSVLVSSNAPAQGIQRFKLRPVRPACCATLLPRQSVQPVPSRHQRPDKSRSRQAPESPERLQSRYSRAKRPAYERRLAAARPDPRGCAWSRDDQFNGCERQSRKLLLRKDRCVACHQWGGIRVIAGNFDFLYVD